MQPTTSIGKIYMNVYPDPKLRYALVQSSPATQPCHFAVFALDPVIGVEDSNRRDFRSYWSHAFYAAQNIISPKIPPAELGLAINPQTRRGQHQLHIHFGRIKAGYREKLEALPRDDRFH